MTANPLLDRNFLVKLDNQRERETFAKIIALTFDENPIETIEGRVTTGTINIDGTSSVRRTCNLTLVAKDFNVNDFYWGLKTKFRLEIGLRNQIDESYPDIIWFSQGTFVITAFNTNQSTTNCTITITGKDKMCLLNGDLGGSLNASIDFGTEEFVDLDAETTTYTKVPIQTIIREALHTYAQEPYHNIIINDLDEAALELLEYKGDDPIYLLRNVDTNEFENFTTNGETPCKNIKTGDWITLETIPQYDPRVELEPDLTIDVTEVEFDSSQVRGKKFTIAKLEYGQTAGYRITDLVYAGELVSNIGESLTSILDKIVKMLGEYEYFYNIDGQFVFQRKHTYINTSWNNIVKTGEQIYEENAASAASYTYYFENQNLISSFQNTPNLANLKNDFSIWGNRESISGVKIPVHYRYAIGTIPKKYTTVHITIDDIKDYNAEHPDSQMTEQTSITFTSDKFDWRELIYRMARDFRQYGQLDNFMAKVIEANKGNGTEFDPDLYPSGMTGYEAFYVDIESFWRDLYNPEGDEEDFYQTDENKYWNKTIIENPAQLNFWFDFLDAESELGQYSVQSVGDRVKAVNDNDITSIYFREVPNLLFTTYQQYKDSEAKYWTGYIPVFIQSELESLFNISSQGKCAKDVLDEYLYNYSYCIESINVTAIPIYYLQSNTRVFIRDELSGINGEYIVDKITLPLNYNGTMSFSATKAPQRIY